MQVDGYSLNAQKEKIRKYADAFEYEIAGEYEDAGKSGKSIAGRAEFKRMLEDIEADKDGVSYVLVFKLSRFSKNAADVLTSLQLMQDFGMNLICVEDGIDSSKDSGKLMISVLSAVVEIERENILVQTMEGRKQKAREGKWNGGFAPYGYKLVSGKLEIEEQEAVRIIFDKYVNTVWQCMNATKNGIANCPNCKAIDEAVLEGAFLDTFGLLAGNFDDVLDVVLSYVEESADSNENMRKKQQVDKDISSLESKRSRMTDMLIDSTISKEVYEEKMAFFARRLHELSGRRELLDEFDRAVFESIIDRVIVGGYEKDGTPDPYKLIFVLKGNQTGTVPHAKKQFKEKSKKLKEVGKV